MHEVVGLSEKEVDESRIKNGLNQLTEQETETFMGKLLENLKDPMIIILIVALVIVIILSIFGYTEWYEGVGIGVAVALATLVATFSEFKNEQTFQKLQEEASRIFVNVFRGHELKMIGIDKIVVGDKVFLQPGDKIPADGRIFQGTIKVNQAMLNGEPEPVKKTVAKTEAKGLDSVNEVFRGTIVEDGECVLEVTEVGDSTLFGKLAKSLKGEERIGPLRLKLSQLANDIAKFGYFGAPLIAIAFLVNKIFIDFDGTVAEYFLTWDLFLPDLLNSLILAVIIIVVVVPEGLPMMIAIVLAQNMKKLLKSKVLVRQLMGIETAGSLNILFSDKTGTITKGALDAVGFFTVDESKDNGLHQLQTLKDFSEKSKDLLVSAVYLNTSCVVNPHAENEHERILGGNSTDRAMLYYINADKEEYNPDGEVTSQVMFSSARKFSAVYVSLSKGEKITYLKGAAEKVLELCDTYYTETGEEKTLSNDLKDKFNNYLDGLADDGYRIIGVATSKVEASEDSIPEACNLIGFSLIRDELREDSKDAIALLNKSGIQVVMLTGDRHGTAVAISKDVGLMFDESHVALKSDELNAMSDEEVKAVIPNLRVVSRCLPQDKTRLVKLAQSIDMVVGMTGDGVNDSPALSNSDVGFGLGSGTEVAKEASDIVILDDRLSSIVSAVHYGRVIYRNVQKFITFQLTVNVAAILLAFIGPFLGFELPLTMIQLLWINLIMDTLAALAFSGEPPLPKHLEEKPKSREEGLISKPMWSSILGNGLFMTALCIVFLKADFIKDIFERSENSEAVFLTAFFAVFVFLNNFNKLNVRVEGTNLFHHITQNQGFIRVVFIIFVVQVVLTYFGGEMFRTYALNLQDWIWIMAISFLIIPFDLVRKMIFKPSEK